MMTIAQIHRKQRRELKARRRQVIKRARFNRIRFSIKKKRPLFGRLAR